MPESSKTARIRPAATVLVCRPAGDGFEVFMVKRHGKSVFMPSVHVFPGGRVEEGDFALARSLPPEARAAARLDGLDDDVTAAAFGVAAVRETAEECGLLLARDRAGRRPSAATARRVFEALRDGASFAELLAETEAAPDLAALHPFAWWITPDFEPRQYDTRFFVAEAPPGQEATFDDVETTEGLWLAPAEAVARFRSGAIRLAPPTLASLELLAEAGSPRAALDAVIRPIRPVRPRIVEDAGGAPVLVLPGDPLYPDGEPRVLPHRTRFRVLGKGRFA
ncbi:NUDIX hydrolase [Rhodocaloribacter sp.]